MVRRKGAMAASESARRTVEGILARNPPAVFRVGGHGFRVRFLKHRLPTGFAGRRLAGSFGLDRLAGGLVANIASPHRPAR